MLDSVKVARRQSEIRQALAEMAGQETLTDETRAKMDTLDREYQDNERRYRAHLISEAEEREKAKGELETRSDREWGDMMRGFEVRQALFALDEGRSLTGQTAEIVAEMRTKGGYRGIPVPLEALETRNTVASGTPNPVETMGIVDRLFAATTVSRMGGAIINIGMGEREYPVVSSSIAAGWAATEGGNVALADAFTTADKALAPDNTFGVQLRVTRKALKQSGQGLEEAMRRDLAGAIQTGLDKAAFLGTGADGQPLGVIPGAATYGITNTDVSAAVYWAVFRAAVVRFMNANAAASPSDVRVMIRPEVWSALDAQMTGDGGYKFEWDRLKEQVGSIVVTTNALAAPAGGPPAESTALLTTSAGGLPPLFMATWGGVDLIRDPFTDAQSGGLRITGLVTADVTVARGSQIEILSGLQ